MRLRANIFTEWKQNNDNRLQRPEKRADDVNVFSPNDVLWQVNRGILTFIAGASESNQEKYTHRRINTQNVYFKSSQHHEEFKLISVLKSTH